MNHGHGLQLWSMQFSTRSNMRISRVQHTHAAHAELQPQTMAGPDSTDATSDDEFASLMRKVADVGPDVPTVAPPTPNQVIGEKYRIGRCLGRGGMGMVFEATHVVSQKRVALKWLLSPATDERRRLRLVREAQAAGRIEHPNVVNVYDVGEERGCNYLVMELLRGETLRQRLSRGRLQARKLIRLLLPAMRGVAAVHRAQVIHRDLKPDNIFLCADSEPERTAKVLDFGISGIAGDDCVVSLTQEGTLLGTPAYMAPEQLQDARAADERSDLYSFGVILYEALTGRRPFEADSYPAMLLAILNRQPVPPSALCPEISRALERVLLRALAKRPEDRFPSMNAFIAALVPFATKASCDQPQRAPRRWGRWLLAAGLLGLAGSSLAPVSQLALGGCARIVGASLPHASLKFVKLQVRNSGGRVLGVPHGRQNNGEPLILWDTEDAQDGPADQWWYPRLNTEDGTYSFINMRTHKCFEVNNNDKQRGASIVQWSCQPRGEQRFFLDRQGGWFRLQAKLSGKYVTVGGGAMENLAPIIQDDARDTDAQLFEAAGEKWGDFQ